MLPTYIKGLLSNIFRHEVPPECVEVLYLRPGETVQRRAFYIVYKGIVESQGQHYEGGEYIVSDGVRAEEESIVALVDEGCVKEPSHHLEECTVKRLAKFPVIWVSPQTAIRDAVRIMHEKGISSVVVMEGDTPIGIFTDTDLRRVLAEGVDLGTPIGDAVQRRVVSIQADSPCYEAISKMMEHNIKHLLVVNRGEYGMLTARDLAYRMGPFYIYYHVRLRRANTLEELGSIVRELVDALHREGGKFRDPSQVPNAEALLRIASRMVDRVADSIARQMGGWPPGCLYAITGSAGRDEQFLLTDRDTLAIYGDEKCLEFVRELELRMDAVGFPGCPNGYTARRFAIRADELKETVKSWALEAETHNVEVSLLADARPAFTVPQDAVDALMCAKSVLTEYMRGNRQYVRLSLMYRPALGLFGRLLPSFDFKARALAPIEYPIRALAVIHGIIEPTSTIGRINALRDERVLPPDLAGDLMNAYGLLLRFKVWLYSMGTREIDVGSLPSTERMALRGALHVASRLHEFVERNYA